MDEIPVIAHAIDGIPELVNHDEDGILVPLGDSVAMATAIKKCMADTALCQHMGAKGREKVSHSFSLQQCRQKHTELFQALLS